MKAAPAINALLQTSRMLYDELFASEGFQVDWQTKGIFFVFQTKEGHEHHAHTNELLSSQFNMGAERYDGDDVLKLEPALKSGLAGGWHYRNDAHLRPDQLMANWKRWLTE